MSKQLVAGFRIGESLARFGNHLSDKRQIHWNRDVVIGLNLLGCYRGGFIFCQMVVSIFIAGYVVQP